MKKFLFAFLAIMPLAASAFALLPPLYETAAVIKAIVTDPQLGQKLEAGEVIVTIQRNETGYEVITNKHRVQVDVTNEPAERPGPAHYKIVFQEAVPLKAGI